MQAIDENTYKEDLVQAISSIPNFEILENKNILITGATGLIASVITDIFRMYNLTQKSGITIFLTSRDKNKLARAFGNESEEIKFVETDLLSEKDLPDRIDYVIHSASVASPDRYVKYPVETVQSNLNSTLMLLNKYKNVQKFIFVSSGEIYGEVKTKDVRFSEDMTGEFYSLSPRSSYPISKLMAENICVDYFEEYGSKTVIARPSHVYGPNFNKQDKRAASYFLTQGLKKKNIELKSSGAQFRSFTYVNDAASGIISALTVGQPGQAYNVSNTAEAMTMLNFVELVAEEANIDYSFRKEDTEVSHAVLSNKKLTELGWKPIFSNKKGISHSMSIRRNINN